MGTAGETIGAIQALIDEQQTLDAIEYGIRSIEVSGNAFGASGIHAAQIVRGCQAATGVLRRFVTQNGATLHELKAARKEQREVVKLAQEIKRERGTARQIRIALAA